MSEIIVSERLPILALRGLCVFPRMLVHFDVGRERSIRAVDEAMKRDQEIYLVAQRDVADDDPGHGDLYGVGTVAHIRQVLKLPGDTVRILVEGEFSAPASPTGCRTSPSSRGAWSPSPTGNTARPPSGPRP